MQRDRHARNAAETVSGYAYETGAGNVVVRRRLTVSDLLGLLLDVQRDELELAPRLRRHHGQVVAGQVADLSEALVVQDLIKGNHFMSHRAALVDDELPTGL